MSARPSVIGPSVIGPTAGGALVRGIRAPLWLIPGALVSALAAAVFIDAHPVFPPIAWTALGVTAGLFAAMLIVARAMPLGFTRATVFAWLLMSLTMVAVAAALALAVIGTLP